MQLEETKRQIEVKVENKLAVHDDCLDLILIEKVI